MLQQNSLLKAIISKELTSLQRFAQMSSRAKRWIYMAKIRPKILYPVSPWASMKPRELLTLQKIQNKALNFIGGYQWNQFITARTKHEDQRLPTIGKVLHAQNSRIWNKIRLSNNEKYELWDGRNGRLRDNRVFYSSLRTIHGNPHDYTTLREVIHDLNE